MNIGDIVIFETGKPKGRYIIVGWDYTPTTSGVGPAYPRIVKAVTVKTFCLPFIRIRTVPQDKLEVVASSVEAGELADITHKLESLTEQYVRLLRR